MTENQKKLLETLQAMDSLERRIEKGVDVELAKRTLSVIKIGYEDLIKEELKWYTHSN